MNLLLLDALELEGDLARLVGRRADHAREVLRARAGQELRVGVLDRGVGTARVVSSSASELVLAEVSVTPRPRPTLRLVLAVPRPKALSRLLQAAASFGLHALDLTPSWKVDPSYLHSPRLTPTRLLEDVRLGLEQGGHCHLPEITLHQRFRALVEDYLPDQPGFGDAARLVLHPGAERAMHEGLRERPDARAEVLALGPDGGFIDAELSSLERAGFLPVRLGRGILRTEVAVIAALAQLELALAFTRSAPP